MPKILIASKNPVKVEATRVAFSKYFEDTDIISISVPSGVPEQPINNETYEGARNRVLRLKERNDGENLNAEYLVGIEGGIVQHFNKWFAFGVICIMNNLGKIGFGTSVHFELPDSVTGELLNGAELGPIMDKMTGQHNTKQKGGAIGYFTKGVIRRQDIYEQGLVSALIPFLNHEFD